MATATVIWKGGVSGGKPGSSRMAFRRIVARAFAKQYATVFERVTAPFQFALRTRAGTDAIGHALRALSDADGDTVILSLDGIGAYDHIRRASFLRKMLGTASLHALLPFARMLARLV